jgi:hypothetical protein
MDQNPQQCGSEMAQLDAHLVSAKEYEELPELTDADLERAVWRIAGQEVTPLEGRVAFHSLLNK